MMLKEDSCVLDEACLFCEYSSLVDITLKIATENKDIILNGMYCEYYGRYSIPKYNTLKKNPFNTNIITGREAEKIIEYYNDLDLDCDCIIKDWELKP